MHILMVTTYFEPDSGAAAVRLSRLARILAGRGHQVTVLTTVPHYPQGEIAPGYRSRFSVTETVEGIRVIRAWLWATPSSRISRKFISQNTFMLTAFLRGLPIPRPDVIFIEAQPVFTNLAGVLLSAIKRVPYVLNVSDLWPDHLLSVGALTESSPIYRAARGVVDFTYRKAAAIAVMSPAWGAAISRYIGSGDKIRLIYNGVDLERFSPAIDAAPFCEKYDIPADQKVVSFISTFTTQYDFETMLAVTERLSQRDDVTVMFCGGGSQQDKLEAWLTQHPSANVRYLGWIDFDDIPGAWAASDVTMLAMRDESLYEGTIPAKLFEIMGVGVPVVAALKGAGANVIHAAEAGITVPPGDVDGLTAGIARLLDDDATRQQMAASGRAYAEAHFDPSRVADRYEALLERSRRGRG